MIAPYHRRISRLRKGLIAGAAGAGCRAGPFRYVREINAGGRRVKTCLEVGRISVNGVDMIS